MYARSQSARHEQAKGQAVRTGKAHPQRNTSWHQGRHSVPRARAARPPSTTHGRSRVSNGAEGDRLHLTSSIAPKDEGSSRDLRPPPHIACAPPLPPTCAVHRPGNPEASLRSHGLPRYGLPGRGSGSGGIGARSVLAGSLKVSLRTDIPEEVKRRVLYGLRAEVSAPRSG